MTDPAPSLDGRRFAMVSSTSSVVDPVHPTVFRYHERDGALWGEYEGDTVALGRFVGTREGDGLRISFVHVLADGGTVVTGSGTSTMEADGAGLRLVERYALDGVEHVSVCAEA